MICLGSTSATYRETNRMREQIKHPRERQSSCARAFGFTLVELLVVVAVIGLTLSILVPSLGRTRDQAKLIICRTHLRNVCVAALLYGDDNNGALPVDTMIGPGYEDVTNVHTALFAALDGYLEGLENYYCPSETRPELRYSQLNFDAGVMGYFYFSCDRASGNRDISVFLRWDVGWPRHVRTSMHPRTWVISDSWFRGRPTSHRWFHRGVNYATLDTSVQMLHTAPREKFK
jgi:prepilin-type N-terminal cleavage/methylation domain-containing protein